MRAVKNHDAVSNATRLERRQDVRNRIAFLFRQEEDVLAEKRKRIEEMLWSMHEAAIGDYLETVEIDGKTIERPKRISIAVSSAPARRRRLIACGGRP